MITNTLFGQQNNNYIEKTFLNTDRSLYLSGDSIYFSAQIQCNNSNSVILSQVFYVELISPFGKQIIGEKYKIENKESIGKIIIPQNLISGNYYLRAYTKYMRNQGPSEYSYCYVKIVNPYIADVFNEQHESTILNQSSLIEMPESENLFDITLNKKEFKNRENVIVKISNKNGTLDSYQNIGITVSFQEASQEKNIRINRDSIATHSFYSETKGISVSGIVKDQNSGIVMPNKKVNLSILTQKGNIFFSFISDSLGRFFFSLPDLYGYKDIFISIEHSNQENPMILIDNDYCSKSINLPNPTFFLTKKEQTVIAKIVVNNEVRQYINPRVKDDLNENDSSTHLHFIPFYGIPSYTVYINDYIELPLLEDYFKEISLPVKITRTKGQQKFKILGNHPELSIYDPLIMVDFVPVYEVSDILEMLPQKVSRIDIVTAPYVKGDITYGGILNIISVKNDFASIILPKSGLFLNFKFLSEDQISNYQEDPLPENYPDTRNTLYWNPNVQLDAKGQANFTFKTADTDAVYSIKISVITTKGEKNYSTSSFEVK